MATSSVAATGWPIRDNTPVTAQHRVVGAAIEGADSAQTHSLSQIRPIFNAALRRVLPLEGHSNRKTPPLG